VAIRVAVIGCGGISRFHFPGLEEAGATVRVVCDLDAEAARPWKERFGARYTDDYRDAVADPEVDLVDITTISSLHKAIALEAIAHGKAVICEKTLCEQAADSAEIVRAAADSGVKLFTSYMKRFIPAVVEAKRLVESGELGSIMSTSIRAFQCWGDLWTDAPGDGFFAAKDGASSEVVRRYGGGILVCGGSHILDLVGHFLGRPERLFATMRFPQGGDFDVQAAAMLETPRGVAHFEALAHPLDRIGFLRDGWDERIEISGTKGRIEVLSAAWDQFESKVSVLRHYDRASGTEREYRYPAVSPFARAIGAFCSAVERDDRSVQSPVTGYDVDELISCVKESARRGTAVTPVWLVG
jgi:predicted dehydrogenase